MKKRYFVLLFLLIGMVVYFGKVDAASDITSLPSNAGTNTDKDNYWTNFKTSEGSKYIRGMRVTLLKTDGTKVGHSYNILAYDEHYDILNNYENYIVLGTGCSKAQYLMGKSGCNVYSKTTKSGTGNPWNNFNGKMGKASSLNNLFSYFNVSLKSYIENWKLDEIWQWADKDKLNLTDQTIRNLYGTLFGLTDNYIDSIASNPDLLSDLWIAIEPITMITFDGKMYLGTSYELGFLGYVNWKPVNSAMGRVLPCAALTTGTIIQKYPDAPGVASGSYFYGALNIVNENETASYGGGVSLQKVCAKSKGGKSSDILAEDYVKGNKGAGIGLVYFKDTFKLGLTCAEVKNGISNYTDFVLALARTYPVSGLNGIYQLPEVKNGIKYTHNGQQKIADSQWYINECTCYGVYDAYKNAGNNLELYKLPSANIKTIFNDKATIFTSFTERIKQYVKEKSNTNPNSVGSVSDWNYAKYERYACGHTEANCQDVNFGTANLRNPYENEDCVVKGGWWLFPTWEVDQECLRKKRNYQDKIDYFDRICKNLPLYLDRDFTDDYISNNKNKYNQCFDIYQEFLGGPSWNIDYYQESGCVSTDKIDKDKIKYNCTPAYDVGTCIDGKNVYYNDSSVELNSEDYWNYCVFGDEQASYDIPEHKWSDKTETLTYYDENISSDYCEVYCIENLTGSFNSETITVKAGQHFVWDNHSLSGNRTCRTKSIDWNGFVDDLKETNDEIQIAFNEYLVARDQQEAFDSASATPSGSCGCYHPCKIDEKTGTYPCDEECPDTEYEKSYPTVSYGTGDTKVTVEGGTVTACDETPTKDFDVDGKYDDYKEIMNDSKKIYNEMLKCYNEDKSSTWVNSGTSDTNKASSWDQWLYNVDPKAYVSFEYKINGVAGAYQVIDELMDRNIQYTEIQNTNDCKNVSGGIEVLTNCNESGKYDVTCKANGKCSFSGGTEKSCNLTCKDNDCSLSCSNVDYKCTKNSVDASNNTNLSCKIENSDQCVRQNLSIKKCTTVKMSKGVDVDFSIPDGIYEFINKDTHISFNADQFNSLKSQYISEGKTFNYIYLGFSNFPVEYKTPDGLYGEEYGNGKLAITYEDLGYKVQGKVTAVDSILSTIDSAKYGKWSCEFEVYSELIPENPDNPGGGSSKEGDINLIYRPIDLYDPFPDIDAGGRNTGTNWCYGLGDRNDCSNTNKIVEEYILNNRGVEGHEIYSEEPMYTFILTPTIIKEIRKYNDNNSYADYYGSLDNQTYDFQCNTDTGKTCISEYLTYLIDITGAKNQPGVCVEDKYRSYNDPNNFDSCRY